MRPNDSIQEALAVAQSNGMLLAPHDRALRSALYRRANDPALISPLPGIYADAATWNALSPLKQYLQILKTLANMHPNWIFCGLSAAALYGLAVPYTRMHLIHIAGGETITKGRIARHHIANPQPTLVQGIPTTSLERTNFDCVVSSGFRTGLAIADSTLRVYGLTQEELGKRIEEACHGLPGINRVRAILPYADGRSENGGESYARAVMIENGVMIPDLQVPVIDELTNTVYRSDFGWRLKPHPTMGELDGKEKYERIAREQGKTIEDVMREERLRESRIRNKGFIFARFSFKQVREVTPLLAILDSCGVPRVRAPLQLPGIIN